MNILIMTSIYPEPIEYGVPVDSKAVHYFAKELVTMGHDVTVYHLYSSPVSRLFKNTKKMSHLYVNIQDGVKVVFGQIQLVIPHRYSGFKIQQIAIARKYIKYQKDKNKEYDLIITHFPMTLFWFAKTVAENKRVSFVMHGVDLRELEKMSVKCRKKMISKIVSTSHLISYRSVSLRERSLLLGLGTIDSPVLYSGIPESIIPEKHRVEKKIDTSKAESFLFAGKINKQKRVDLIIKALSIAQINRNLYIIGDGPEKTAMEMYAKELNLGSYVRFGGFQQREEVAKSMFNSDVFVMVSQNETLGLVYLEAMAQGCIVIGTKGEGIDGIIINNVNGFLVEPDNPEALAIILKKIIDMDILQLHEIQRNAYETASKMTNSKMSDYYLSELSKG